MTVEPADDGQLGWSPDSRVSPGHHARLTADGAEIEAAAPSLSMLFDESGLALAELASVQDAGAPASSWRRVQLIGPDLAGLAWCWFSELIADASLDDTELVDVAVDVVAPPGDRDHDGWRLQGRIGLRRLFRRHGSARHEPRVSIERLSVETTEGRWRLRARLGRTDTSPSTRAAAVAVPGIG
jgi:hypothetical protein